MIGFMDYEATVARERNKKRYPFQYEGRREQRARLALLSSRFHGGGTLILGRNAAKRAAKAARLRARASELAERKLARKARP